MDAIEFDGLRLGANPTYDFIFKWIRGIRLDAVSGL